jgi:hypothetical protein
MRWIQKVNDDGTSRFEPRDESARQHSVGLAVHGDIQAFVSPVDGSIISDRKQLREHNKRNGVVSADEFTPEHYATKKKERDRVLNGEHTTQESFARKQELYEKWTRAERQN